ncbi:hypothetical protein A2477_03170 [Candidatus Falkowbacteria bacterium RIFOXYC2_FULL_47_12]|uniref:Enoyl reductase (ER) domain-containing protein n=2 Tax=Candidatus Falkowiibacteriota TaxID=1752728 RepID=A0A1F5TQT8_9BACT|nr:MAG: hypothetical protein A2242_01865 [Candidatus Falkowbacteria bacterium RIFOXYA2_FULL_47_9]OGF41330.1 MAG: hypothetical protein A2477_03170 [Candidatus Falkowbacteria bacterium RIFOXYC2_FULL_47_12]
MRALVKKKPTNPPQWYEGLELKDKPEPQVSAERPVKLNIISAGICGTDVGIYQGKDALANAMAKLSTDEVITGHEFCGRVAELHPSARIFIAQLLLRRRNTTPDVMAYCQGKTVDELARDENFEAFLNKHFYASAEMHFTCGRCLQCRTGHEHVCKKTIGKGMHEDGAFTEYMVIPANRLVLFEDGEISPDIISFMDALGNAVHTAQSADLVGKNILITGAGVQGLGSCAVARQLGANRIYVTDAQAAAGAGSVIDKLAIATKLGADAVFNVATEAGREELRDTIAQDTDNTGVDVVFEMSGNYRAYEQMFENVRMGGTILLLGLPAGALTVDFSKNIIFKGLTIRGIYGRRVFDTWDLMRYLLGNGLEDIILKSGIITHRLPIADFETGFQALISGEAVKVLLKP